MLLFRHAGLAVEQAECGQPPDLPDQAPNAREWARTPAPYPTAPRFAVSDFGTSGAEENEPHDAQDQNREPGRNRQQREHRRAGFSLASLGRGFDDLALSLRCHGDLSE
jgi:hypothetical protein